MMRRLALLVILAVPDVVLGADTVVTIEGQILGKPRDRADAAATLRRLSSWSSHLSPFPDRAAIAVEADPGVELAATSVIGFAETGRAIRPCLALGHDVASVEMRLPLPSDQA